MSPPKKKLKQSSVSSYFLTNEKIQVHDKEEERSCLKNDSRPTDENGETHAANIHDIGYYVGQQEMQDETKYKLLVNPWTPTDDFK